MGEQKIEGDDVGFLRWWEDCAYGFVDRGHVGCFGVAWIHEIFQFAKDAEPMCNSPDSVRFGRPNSWRVVFLLPPADMVATLEGFGPREGPCSDRRM